MGDQVSPMRGWTLLFAPSLLAVVIVGCVANVPEGGDDGHSPATVPLDSRRTTAADIAVGNLDASIESLRVRLARQPNNLEAHLALVERLLTRTAYLGSYDDFQEADDVSARALARYPDDARAIMQRAGYLGAVHRFVEARERLDEAQAAGAEASELERARLVVDLALGVAPASLLPRAHALVGESETFSRLTTLASVLGAAGHYEDADATYMRALARYRDVSPFALAWVSFTRGVMWGEAADRPDLALVLYRDAVQRLPQYVVANVHLSELEASAEAIERLERIPDSVGDPEPGGRLSQRLSESDPDRASELQARSAARYDTLLARHREAFLDHGAEFFAAGADPERGLALALENVELRNVPRAYLVAIGAALAADELDTACRLVEQSGPLQATHRVLQARARELENACR